MNGVALFFLLKAEIIFSRPRFRTKNPQILFAILKIGAIVSVIMLRAKKRMRSTFSPLRSLVGQELHYLEPLITPKKLVETSS